MSELILNGIMQLAPGITVNASGDLTAIGYIEGKKTGVAAFLNAPDNTTITTAGTFYPIDGSFTNLPFEDFSIAIDKISYTGTKTQHYEIDWHATVAANGPNRIVSIGVAINSEFLTLNSPSVMSTLCKTAEEAYSFSGTGVVELTTGATIQLQITSSTNIDVVTVSKFTTTINQFFK